LCFTKPNLHSALPYMLVHRLWDMWQYLTQVYVFRQVKETNWISHNSLARLAIFWAPMGEALITTLLCNRKVSGRYQVGLTSSNWPFTRKLKLSVTFLPDWCSYNISTNVTASIYHSRHCFSIITHSQRRHNLWLIPELMLS
jgi:hypothetical protein